MKLKISLLFLLLLSTTGLLYGQTIQTTSPWPTEKYSLDAVVGGLGSSKPGLPTSHTVSLSWSSITCLSGTPTYNVYRSITTGQETSYQTALTTTSYTDAAVIDGTTYFYTVTAVCTTQGESAFSNETNAVIPAATQAPVMNKAVVN